jgi:membrane peptidoglycan carboxypeptidase
MITSILEGAITLGTGTVWVGYRRGNISMRNVGGLPAVYGGSIPALIWHRIMSVATAEMRESTTPQLNHLVTDTPPPPSPTQPPGEPG